MKRHFRIAAALLLLCLCFPIANAHPGGTDSNGGHTNHSTGQYHYHHGYPEHQHTNGICPYDYDDKTGQNSGTSSGVSVKKTAVPVRTVKPTNSPVKSYSYTENVSGVRISEDALVWAFIIAAGVVFSFIIAIKRILEVKNNEISNLEHQLVFEKERYEENLTQAQEEYENKVQLAISEEKGRLERETEKTIDAQKRFDESIQNILKVASPLKDDHTYKNLMLYGELLLAKTADFSHDEFIRRLQSLPPNLYCHANADLEDILNLLERIKMSLVPEHLSIDSDGNPYYTNDGEWRDFLVFVYGSGKKFHRIPHAYGEGRKMHLFDALRNEKTPCETCYSHGIPFEMPKWFPLYNKYEEEIRACINLGLQTRLDRIIKTECFKSEDGHKLYRVIKNTRLKINFKD